MRIRVLRTCVIISVLAGCAIGMPHAAPTPAFPEAEGFAAWATRLGA